MPAAPRLAIGVVVLVVHRSRSFGGHPGAAATFPAVNRGGSGLAVFVQSVEDEKRFGSPGPRPSKAGQAEQTDDHEHRPEHLAQDPPARDRGAGGCPQPTAGCTTLNPNKVAYTPRSTSVTLPATRRPV
jgi:hypothetical protein